MVSYVISHQLSLVSHYIYKSLIEQLKHNYSTIITCTCMYKRLCIKLACSSKDSCNGPCIACMHTNLCSCLYFKIVLSVNSHHLAIFSIHVAKMYQKYVCQHSKSAWVSCFFFALFRSTLGRLDQILLIR